MTPGCLRAGVLLERRRAGLSDGDRLFLEEHLGGCQACRTSRRALDEVTRAREAAADARESGDRRDRAIRGALARAARNGDRPEAAPRPRRWIPALALGLAAAAAVAIAVRPRPPRPAEDRVLAGDARAGGLPLAAGASLPGDEIETAAGATIAVAHAHVTLAPRSRIAWRRERATVALRVGRVEVLVDPAPRRPFRVETTRFTVEVLGTRFVVDEPRGRVQVMEGRVRVVGPDGAELAAGLGAGAVWTMPVPAPAPVPPSPPPPAAPAPPPPEAPPPAERAAPASHPERPPPGPSAPERLARARTLLAAGDVPGASRQIEAAIAAHPPRAVQAEAHTLLADAALVGGRAEEAIDLYGFVHRRYPDLRAGENALFAQARLEANAGRAEEARRLLRQYLERYPNGAFHREARARLDALDAKK